MEKEGEEISICKGESSGKGKKIFVLGVREDYKGFV